MSHRNHVAPMESIPNKQHHQSATPLSTVSKDKILKFDMFYKELGTSCKQEDKRIDFVLVYPEVDMKEIAEDEDEMAEFERRKMLRAKFEAAIKEEGMQMQKVKVEDKYYTKIHCPFKRLCLQAERVSLEMPLLGCESEKEEQNFFTRWVKKKFVTDDEVDMVSAPFVMEKIHLFVDFDDPTNFFRPSIRSLLVEHILINVDLRRIGIKHDSTYKHTKEGKNLGNCFGCLKNDDEELGDLQRVGLDYMMVESVYTDKFILHEESSYDPDADSKQNDNLPHDPETLKYDPRLDMQLTWPKFFKFQPLWKIRNYFGEKIAFYFAWSGTLASSLWLPMLFGLAVFIYGLVESVRGDSTSSSTSNSNSTFTDLFNNIKGSFDNDVTPYFAMFISVWGTLFLEIWKRKQATLAYQWDVEQFEENEPDRPEFYGTKQRVDPVTNERDWYYPFTRRAWKLFLSSLALLFMVCVVAISVLAVIVYRVIATVDYCPDLPDSQCLMVSTIVSSILNAVSILILGFVYDWLAVKLTNWENHRTQTQYNDALIIKLFAFQFVNNYASCFYIAFFRGRFEGTGIVGRGEKYVDSCEGTCMSQLSFQVMILMITKPMPKFAKDVILPFVLKQFKKRCQCCSCIPFLRRFLQEGKPKSEKTLLEIELEKPSLGNFTLGEYTEKIIQYGLMMLFAASFPLAPLLALLLNLIDIRIDAKRMLWWFQRPRAEIAEDIGTWYVILQFVNFAGVVTNAFLIAFTSAWGAQYSVSGKLWIVVGYEHIVFTLKFLLAYLIPDTPAAVSLAIRKKRHHIMMKMKTEEDKGEFYNLVKKAMQEKRRESHDALSLEGEGMPRKPGRNFVDGDETEIRRLKKKKHRENSGDGGHSRPLTHQSMRTPEVGYMPETYYHM